MNKYSSSVNRAVLIRLSHTLLASPKESQKETAHYTVQNLPRSACDPAGRGSESTAFIFFS